MSSKNFGLQNELEFKLAALKKGLIPSVPYGNNQKYDVIIDNGEKRYRVQIKSTKSINKSKNAEQWQFLVSHGSSAKKKYTKEDIDFYALYIEPKNTWFIIPVEEINATKIGINPYSRESKYARYKEAWELLQK